MIKRASLLIVFLLLCIAMAGALLDERDAASTMVGKKPDDMALPLLSDPDRLLPLSAFDDQVTLVHLFASWCGTCMVEHPLWLELKHLAPNAKLIGVVWKDKRAAAEKFLSARGNPYDLTLLDEHGTLTTRLAMTGVPETLILDRNGNIAYHSRLPLSDDEIRHVVLPLVERLTHE